MKVTVVVQARIGSTRFPGKVLAALRGRPMLEHVLTRAARSRCMDDLVLATSDEPRDDVLIPIGERCGALVVRGSEEDVLSRYIRAAEVTHSDVVVRITADSPLLDPRLVDRVTRELVTAGADYSSNIEPPSYPDGYDVEAMSADALRRMVGMATLPYQREHVTAVAREDNAAYSHVQVRSRHDYSAYRLTVDVPADLDRVTAIMAEAGSDAGLGAVLSVLRRRPDLAGVVGMPSRDERYHAQRRSAAAGRDS